jgi:hypothetical protein
MAWKQLDSHPWDCWEDIRCVAQENKLNLSGEYDFTGLYNCWASEGLTTTEPLYGVHTGALSSIHYKQRGE